MFTTKRVTVRNQVHELKWVAEDEWCFIIIETEWQRFHKTVLQHVTDDKLVLQAGGNCGLYPFYYSFLFDKVVTFEPEPLNFTCLAQNCISNQFIKFNTALGDKCGFVKIGNPDPDRDNIGMYTVGGGDIDVYTMTIDSLQLNQCSLIHLDVEGYEYNVLKGGIETIKKYKPVIALEISRDKESIDKLLSKNGYKCVEQYGVENNNFVYKVEK